jgi:hypothetical protein
VALNESGEVLRNGPVAKLFVAVAVVPVRVVARVVPVR